MSEEQLVAAIVAPDDPSPKMVLSDWLEQRGDPRAELMRIEDTLWREPFDLVRYRTLVTRRGELRRTCDAGFTTLPESLSNLVNLRELDVQSSGIPWEQITAMLPNLNADDEDEVDEDEDEDEDDEED